ncbi:hypothetical protein AwDysgo_19310 [Bacteroidales bacterium]|nr:hypothetical protein AwDysgo_19310 [Bacteroidales bacterium]
MPDYEIMLWDTNRFKPDDCLFVKQACEAKKWAYAADYIRLYALYHYGGIYLDMDVMVYRSFDVFLVHSAFSSVEFDPRIFYKNISKGTSAGLGIEAAVIGAEKNHVWIKDILDFYTDREFVNDPKYYWSIIMPKIMTAISIEKYGFRLVPIYQVLKNDIHLYPPDVFSSCFDLRLTQLELTDDIYLRLGENKIRYSYHICAHSWSEGADTSSLSYRFKKLIILLVDKKIISYFKKIFVKNRII